jgi:hypothetical protein
MLILIDSNGSSFKNSQYHEKVSQLYGRLQEKSKIAVLAL